MAKTESIYATNPYFETFRSKSPLQMFTPQLHMVDIYKSTFRFEMGDKVMLYRLQTNSWTNATVSMVTANYVFLTFGRIGNYEIERVSFPSANWRIKVKPIEFSFDDDDLCEIEPTPELSNNVFDLLNQETRPAWSTYEDLKSNEAVQALRKSLDEKRITSDTCLYLIQGKCRFKKHCKASHEMIDCPFCESKLPTYMVSTSAHLRRCFKKYTGTSSPKEMLNGATDLSRR